MSARYASGAAAEAAESPAEFAAARVLEVERARLAELNPTSAAKLAGRLIEASDRNYWTPDDETLEALRRASEEIEDRLEGIGMEMAA